MDLSQCPSCLSDALADTIRVLSEVHLSGYQMDLSGYQMDLSQCPSSLSDALADTQVVLSGAQMALPCFLSTLSGSQHDRVP